ncbi:MAG: GntR family transcriptional regulator [Deltaproteobacteria bacterium]|nr:GntR family transcriptional regulator [Deltaproteobacteria bacterium]
MNPEPSYTRIVNHKTLVEQIVEDLEQKIMEGVLKPGRRLIEAELCEKMRVSRSPLREAFRILESRGFVVSEPRKGIFVSRISPKEAEDIYIIRANLESLAIYLAVKKQNPEVLKNLKNLHMQMIKVAAKGDVPAYFDLNLTFHETLFNACENKRLIQLINTFVKQTMRYRVGVVSVPGWMNSSIENHHAIIQSFESGDAEKAEQLRKNMILSHIQRFSQIDEEEEKNENRS